jgi:prepilin-type processing-associated H-X9-DG protein
VLLIEENERIDDGRWLWPGNAIGTWHERPEKRNTDSAEGSCLFVDGHVGMLNRLDANNPVYCDPYYGGP